MIQKILCALLASLLPLGALAEHIHTPGAWDRDGKHHWRGCECGEKLELAAHQLEDGRCLICGSEVWVYEDGGTDVYNYDDHGETIRSTYYNPQGQAEYDYHYVITYDASGSKTASQTYQDGMLVEEGIYTVDADGWSLPVKITSYLEDGSWSTNEFNEIGGVVKAETYSAQGTLIAQESIEYLPEESGGGYVLTGFMEGGSTYRTAYDHYGNCVFNGYYEADGTVISEFTMEYAYDAQGNRTQDKTYAGERLISENTYVNGYTVSSVEYMEDGSRCVYEYDEMGNTVKHTLYDAQGQVMETVQYGNDLG